MVMKKVRNLSNDDVNDNVISKCDFSFLELSFAMGLMTFFDAILFG